MGAVGAGFNAFGGLVNGDSAASIAVGSGLDFIGASAPALAEGAGVEAGTGANFGLSAGSIVPSTLVTGFGDYNEEQENEYEGSSW